MCLNLCIDKINLIFFNSFRIIEYYNGICRGMYCDGVTLTLEGEDEGDGEEKTHYLPSNDPSSPVYGRVN